MTCCLVDIEDARGENCICDGYWYALACIQIGIAKENKANNNISQPQELMWPRLASVTDSKIIIGGVNKLRILYLRALSRIKAIVAPARAIKLMTIQTAFVCNRATQSLAKS